MGQTYASPMSFAGATRRLLGWPGPMKLLGLLLLPIVWVALVPWYFVVFVIFGVFTIPFRLIRRGQRKSLATQKQMLAEQRAQIDEIRRLKGEA